jgi:hypothetical protein
MDEGILRLKLVVDAGTDVYITEGIKTQEL